MIKIKAGVVDPNKASTVSKTPNPIKENMWYDSSSALRNSVIVYGAPKSGKTELVGKLAEKYNLVWFDLENGHATLRKLPVAWKQRIQLLSIPDTRDFPIAIETMLKVLKGDAVDICTTHGKVGCFKCKKAGDFFYPTIQLGALDSDNKVVIDSGTQLAESAISHITKGTDDDYKYEWEDYRKQGTVVGKLLGLIQQAPYDVVVITHEAEVDMDDKKKKLVPLMGTTRFSRNCAKYFDHVVYCKLANKKHGFGSSTTFGTNLVTGSRTAVEIESDATSSLLAIFDPDYTPAGAVSKGKTKLGNSLLGK